MAVDLVLASLSEVLAFNGDTPAGELGEGTVLVGDNAALDSLGVVALIVEVEQRLEIHHAISVTLANDRAMSQRNSPFRTVGALSDYILATLKEGQQ
jgi:acyl carrier protein